LRAVLVVHDPWGKNRTWTCWVSKIWGFQ
jgi:hypothetical protein